ncbi:unnamed protein product [Clonostachys rosea f. rosea IK726]|uniref:Uncharacterized protein n=1 Tax=Clonostachys rosea f. rosea IK726 TaxID=1349383 RepID=A0ACA9TX97_BIOOC|nr:unnamed protein product [Clonostachys rosea f. rosea IK726]
MGRRSEELTPLLGSALPRPASSSGDGRSTYQVLATYFVLLPFVVSLLICVFAQFLPLIPLLEDAPLEVQIAITLILDDLPEQLQRHVLDTIVDDCVFRIVAFEDEARRRSLIRKGPSSINALITYGLKLLKTVVYLGKISATNGISLVYALPVSAAAVVAFGGVRNLLTRRGVKEVQSCKSKRDELVVDGSSYLENYHSQEKLISSTKSLKLLYLALHVMLFSSLTASIPSLVTPKNQVTLTKLADNVLSLDKTFTKFFENLPKARACLAGISCRSIPLRLFISARAVHSTKGGFVLWKKASSDDANQNDVENDFENGRHEVR